MSTAVRELVPGQLGDERGTWVLPLIRETDPTRDREAAARMRLVALTGRCPCGATMPGRRERRAATRAGRPVRVVHDVDCPSTGRMWHIGGGVHA